MSSTIVCATVFKDGRKSKRTVVRITIIDHDVVSSDTGGAGCRVHYRHGMYRSVYRCIGHLYVGVW